MDRPQLRTTHTVVILPLSALAYQEIRQKLAAAQYEHTFCQDSAGQEFIDLTGIAVQSEASFEEGLLTLDLEPGDGEVFEALGMESTNALDTETGAVMPLEVSWEFTQEDRGGPHAE